MSSGRRPEVLQYFDAHLVGGPTAIVLMDCPVAVASQIVEYGEHLRRERACGGQYWLEREKEAGVGAGLGELR